jgi:hypothetical protein
VCEGCAIEDRSSSRGAFQLNRCGAVEDEQGSTAD